MQNYLPKTKEEHTKTLVQYLPNDRVFTAKNYQESNLYKLFLGLSSSFKAVDDLFCSHWDNLSILTCDNLSYLELWEASVGIPDKIFPNTNSLSFEQRKKQVLVKLRSLGVLSLEDIRNLITLLNIDITIENAQTLIAPPYVPPFIPGSFPEVRFVYNVRMNQTISNDAPPYTPPFIPTGYSNEVRELLLAIKPSNTKINFL